MEERVRVEDTVSAAATPIGRLGGAFMLDRATAQLAEASGYGSWAFYFGGRAGVIGEVDGDVVSAVLAFFPPERVRTGWAEALSVAPPRVTVQRYADACHAWGRSHLAGVDGLDRLCELASRVVDVADVAGAPLFAGWRALPLADDPPARAAHLLHVLREYRGAMHIAAVLASGMRPLEAVLAAPYGERTAKFLGWPQPYPDASHLLERRAGVEEVTDALVVPAYSALDQAERDEIVSLLGKAMEAAFHR